ncbi:MAG: hypothetical protein WAO61_10040 [Solirubrobacterales bacterium]
MSTSGRTFKITIAVIAAIQFVLGAIMIVAPARFADASGLAPAPDWTAWLFAMFGARCLGFGFGMILALRDPAANRGWLQAMLGVQAIDWLATIGYLAAGTVTISQVTTAAVAPLVFIGVLVAALTSRRNCAGSRGASAIATES